MKPLWTRDRKEGGKEGGERQEEEDQHVYARETRQLEERGSSVAGILVAALNASRDVLAIQVEAATV